MSHLETPQKHRKRPDLTEKCLKEKVVSSIGKVSNFAPLQKRDVMVRSHIVRATRRDSTLEGPTFFARMREIQGGPECFEGSALELALHSFLTVTSSKVPFSTPDYT